MHLTEARTTPPTTKLFDQVGVDASEHAEMKVPRDVSQVLNRVLDTAPDSVAVTARSGSLTYAELDAQANMAARALRELGVRAGDRVAACLPNDLDILVAFHGAMRLGAIWVGVSKALAPPEQAYILRDSGASFALFDADTAAQLGTERGSLPDLRTIVTPDGSVEPGSGESWNAVVQAQDNTSVDVAIDPMAPSAIAYTSGTTGYPKGAVHSQVGLLLPGAYLVATRGYDVDLRKGDAFPLTILNMIVLTTLLTSQVGATAIIMDNLSARGNAAWIRDERVTVWNGPPPVLYTMAHDEEILPSDLETLNEVWSGGADLPDAIRQAFEAKFSARIYGTYGLTEAPTVVASEALAEPHVNGSSGRVLPHLEVTIRDSDNVELPTGQVGEICVGVRDPAQIAGCFRLDWGVDIGTEDELPAYVPMLSYWDKAEQSEDLMRGGVMHTGDAGSLDSEGHLIVSDRINLVLNRGGANVYPAEVERVVLSFDPIESCGVLGVPDERLGQRIGMLVQFKSGRTPDVDGLMDHCLEQLARYKVPELVAVVDDLPRNSMGKINRRALAEVGEQEFAGIKRRPEPMGVSE
jgi:long-chain acyl-CoA synthetase